MAAHKKAIEIDPKHAIAHYNLGIVLRDKRQMDDAIAEFKKAIELNPKLTQAHNGLGIVLFGEKQFDDAIAAFKKVVELEPNFAEAYANMGAAYYLQGKFVDSLDAYKKSYAAGNKRGAVWRRSSAQWVENAERMVQLESRLPAVLKGEDKVADGTELKGLQEVCRLQKRFVSAARLFEVAFSAAPKLAEDVKAGHRYDAACFAALAAADKGFDAGKLDDKERSRLRQQALDWLRADLKHWTQQAASGNGPVIARLRQMLMHGQTDTDLTGVRDQDALAKLNAEERAAWEKLWAEVAEVLKRVSEVK
jgi:tetratricopeptide (TPR) repeat protein